MADGKHTSLVLDGGDLYFSRPQLGAEALAREKIRAKAIVAAFNRGGTDAITIGECDLAAGVEFLKALADSARFPFLSANLTDENRRPIFSPYVVVEKGDLKLGLVGASSVMPAGAGYLFQDLLPALETAVKEAHAEADIVILLFHGTDADKEAIISSGMPIDLILQSHVKHQTLNFGAGAIPVAVLGSQGKYLNVITMRIQTPGEVLVDLSAQRRTLNFVERSLGRLRRNQPKDKTLEELYADNPGVLKRIQSLRERETEARSEIQSAVNTLEAERLALDASIRDDPNVLGLVTAAKQAMAKVAAPSTPQASI